MPPRLRNRRAAAVLLLGLALGAPAFAGDKPEQETPEQIANADRLKEMLSDSNKLRVQQGIEALGKLKSPTARKHLHAYIKSSKNAEFSSYAVDALAWKGNKESVDFLCGKEGVRSKRLLVAEAACRTLAKIGDKRAIPTLLEAVKQDKVVLTRASIKAVVELDPKADGMAELLIKKSKHKSSQIREVVAEAMLTVDSDDVNKHLIRMATRDGNSIVRLKACETLGERKAAEAREALEDVAAKDKSKDVRAAAAAALKKLPPKAE